MYGREKSDPVIVAVKPTNNATRLAAELVEPIWPASSFRAILVRRCWRDDLRTPRPGTTFCLYSLAGQPRTERRDKHRAHPIL